MFIANVNSFNVKHMIIKPYIYECMSKSKSYIIQRERLRSKPLSLDFDHQAICIGNFAKVSDIFSLLRNMDFDACLNNKVLQ